VAPVIILSVSVGAQVADEPGSPVSRNAVHAGGGTEEEGRAGR